MWDHVPEGLEIGKRVIAAVHGDEEAPLLGGPTLGDDPPHGVALDARRLRVLVRFVLEVDESALDLEQPRPQLFRSDAVLVGQMVQPTLILYTMAYTDG